MDSLIVCGFKGGEGVGKKEGEWVKEGVRGCVIDTPMKTMDYSYIIG